MLKVLVLVLSTSMSSFSKVCGYMHEVWLAWHLQFVSVGKMLNLFSS